MTQNEKRTHKLKWLFASGGTAITVFSWELLEEALENVIALGISSAIAVLSTFLLVFATQGIKIGIKKTVKVLYPIIRDKIYKEGNDKMKWLQKVGSWIRYNWKSLVGTVASVISGVVTTIAVNAEVLFALPAIVIFGLNFTPIVAGVLVFAGVELGVVCKGFETIAQAKERVAIEKAQKKEKALLNKAAKAIKAEDKAANQTQAQKAKEDAKKAAKDKADAEKKQKEEQHRAELEKAKAKLRAEAQSKS